MLRAEGVSFAYGADAAFSLTGPSGQRIGLTPGRSWVELAPNGSANLG